MSSLDALKQAVIAGKRKDVKEIVPVLIDSGMGPGKIVDEGLIPAMAIVGEKFKNNEIFVPEMLVSARAMKEAMIFLEPLLVKAGIKPKYTAVLGTVAGDLHDIGKNLVGMMWKGANINVVDLGVDVAPDKFVAAIKEHNAHMVGLSTLLTTTMPAMSEALKAIRASGAAVKIMIGGAPITEQFAKEIGADGYCRDAGSAADSAVKLMGG